MRKWQMINYFQNVLEALNLDVQY